MISRMSSAPCPSQSFAGLSVADDAEIPTLMFLQHHLPCCQESGGLGATQLNLAGAAGPSELCSPRATAQAWPVSANSYNPHGALPGNRHDQDGRPQERTARLPPTTRSTSPRGRPCSPDFPGQNSGEDEAGSTNELQPFRELLRIAWKRG